MATYSVSSEAEFNTAVTSVNAGAGTDTVSIVAGTFNITTTKTFTKAVTIIGAGIDVSIITGITDAAAMISLATTGSSWVKNLTLIQNSTVGSSSCITVTGQAQKISSVCCVGGRNKVLGIRARASAAGNTIPTGVAWNCFFRGARGLDAQGDSVGNSPWFDSTITPGSQNAWYTENCVIDKVWDDGQNVFDHAAGGASCTRYCTIIDGSIFGHGHDSADNTNRSTRLMEVYQNTIKKQRTYATEQPIRCNGGMAIVWNNIIEGSYTPSNSFDLRMVQARMDGHTGADWPLLDQPGRSTDSSLWSSAGSPPTSQVAAPVYVWGNTRNGSEITFVVPSGDSQTFIVENRDFFKSAMPGYIPLPWPHPLRPIEAIAAPRRYARSR